MNIKGGKTTKKAKRANVWPLSSENQPRKRAKLPHKMIAKKGVWVTGVDSWLLYNMTGMTNISTDYSTAMTTYLFDSTKLQWSNFMLEEFGINRAEIKSRRLLRTKWVNGRWQFCDKMCQVKLKDGTEHVVSRELVFTALHPMTEREKRNHRLVA